MNAQVHGSVGIPSIHGGEDVKALVHAAAGREY
jgi:hypothetical protein